MGLNPHGMGRGRGDHFKPRAPRGGRTVGQGTMSRQNPAGVLCSPVGYPPEAQFGISAMYGRPCGYKAAPPRPVHRKFPRKNFKKNFSPQANAVHVPDIDLTKPWVTEEIINEEAKKQKFFKTWNESDELNDWRKYKEQKQSVQALYDKARTEFAARNPHEPALWGTSSMVKTSHFYCETCDKSFNTDDNLFLHKAEHETCGKEGCEFTAHPKIIEKHIKMQHASGLYKRIGKLYTEEDIAKWIEERKKNYPTRKVIEEKKILEEEKHNRGERIKSNDSKFNKAFSNRNKRTGKKHFEKKIQRNSKNQKLRKNKKPAAEPKCLEEENPSVRKGVPAFPGIRETSEPEISEKKDFDISDDDWEVDISTPKVVNPVLNSSLRMLAAFYDSDIEDQNDEPQKETGVEGMSAGEDSGPEEVKTVTSKNPLVQGNSNEERGSLKRKLTSTKTNQRRKRKCSVNDSHLEKRSVTLLEKLLKNEIRHERNVILQCVHYVIKNNFFKL